MHNQNYSMSEKESPQRNKNLNRIDKLYIEDPMTYEERISLLKKFQEVIFLQGIDKGTELEICRRERMENFRKMVVRKKFMHLMDYMNEVISVGVERNNRKHYRSPKYKNKKEKKIAEAREKAYKNARNLAQTDLPDWLKL